MYKGLDCWIFKKTCLDISIMVTGSNKGQGQYFEINLLSFCCQPISISNLNLYR